MLQQLTPWDIRFFVLCNLIGSWSEDHDRKVGCVIVGSANEVRSTGHNGLARGVKDLPSRRSREDGNKNLWFEHAERNAIYNLARAGGHAEGCILYVNNFPCAHCARAIIQVGIKELRTFPYDPNDERYLRSYFAAEGMFKDTGLPVRLYDKDDPALLESLNCDGA